MLQASGSVQPGTSSASQIPSLSMSFAKTTPCSQVSHGRVLAFRRVRNSHPKHLVGVAHAVRIHIFHTIAPANPKAYVSSNRNAGESIHSKSPGCRRHTRRRSPHNRPRRRTRRRHRHPLHKCLHIRRGHRADCHRNRNRLLECRNIHSRKSLLGHCRHRTHRIHPRSRPRRRRRHRHPRPRCNRHRTRPRRRFGFHRNRNRLQECRSIHSRRSRRPLHTPHSSNAPTHASMSSQMPSASASAAQDPPPKGVELVSIAVAVSFGNPRTSTHVHRSRTVAHPTGIQFTHAIVYVVADAI